MQLIRSSALFLAICPFLLMAEEPQAEISVVLTRSDSIPAASVNGMTDPYFEGYIQALVDMHYYEYSVVVLVKDHTVYLAHLPKNQLTAKSIISFVQDVPGVKEVKVIDDVTPQDAKIREKYAERPKLGGVAFPQMTVLFQPLLADPRQVSYTLGWRAGDRVIGPQTVGVALGDDFPMYRWLDVLYHGDIQIGIEAGIWSVFNMNPHPNYAGGSAELVNTDFYCGIPITYAKNQWSFRLRGYHISSHLGDEYMVDHPHVKRVNPSIEVIDFYTSYQASEIFRLYVGPGWIVHSDPSFPEDHFYIQYGVEARFAGMKFFSSRLYGTLFYAMHFRNMQFLNYNFDGTFRLGYELSKLTGIGRKFRVYVGYHGGYSLEGQFQKMRTHYWEFNFSYGF